MAQRQGLAAARDLWTKFYFNSWERLQTAPSRRPAPTTNFHRMRSSRCRRRRPTPSKIAVYDRPIARGCADRRAGLLNFFAEIDQDDTNWIIVIKDVGPDASVRTVRERRTRSSAGSVRTRSDARAGSKLRIARLIPSDRSHGGRGTALTREAQNNVVPGEITEYAIDILATANLFRRGHRICVDITSADMPTGVGGATNAEYVPNHVFSSRTTLHKIYHDARRPSHLLLPIIPQD